MFGLIIQYIFKDNNSAKRSTTETNVKVGVPVGNNNYRKRDTSFVTLRV